MSCRTPPKGLDANQISFQPSKKKEHGGVAVQLEAVFGDIGAEMARHLIILRISLPRQEASKPYVPRLNVPPTRTDPSHQPPQIERFFRSVGLEITGSH